MYESTTKDKDGKIRTVRKSMKKEITINPKKLAFTRENTFQSFLKHINNIKKNISDNDVLIHIDFRGNNFYKYKEKVESRNELLACFSESHIFFLKLFRTRP